MNTIYMISYSDDRTSSLFHSGYAMDEEGIKLLALEWYWTGWEGEKIRVEVNVDIDNRTVMVYDPADNDSITYNIFVYDKRES